MILRIVAFKVCGKHRLDVEFNNGVRKRVNVAGLLIGPIFEPLRSTKYFARAMLDAECGTVTWPNGADLAPEALLELRDEARTATKPRNKRMAVKVPMHA